jgi:hypothetical protein
MKVRVTKVPATVKCFLQVIDSTSRLNLMNPNKTDVTPKIGTNWDMVMGHGKAMPPSLSKRPQTVRGQPSVHLHSATRFSNLSPRQALSL